MLAMWKAQQSSWNVFVQLKGIPAQRKCSLKSLSNIENLVLYKLINKPFASLNLNENFSYFINDPNHWKFWSISDILFTIFSFRFFQYDSELLCLLRDQLVYERILCTVHFFNFFCEFLVHTFSIENIWIFFPEKRHFRYRTAYLREIV